MKVEYTAGNAPRGRHDLTIETQGGFLNLFTVRYDLRIIGRNKFRLGAQEAEALANEIIKDKSNWEKLKKSERGFEYKTDLSKYGDFPNSAVLIKKL